MPARIKKDKIKETSPLNIRREEWSEFLRTFSRQHRGWPVQLETHDLVTDENVVSRETALESIDFDLEDEKNPRINVVVHLDNKLIKHILFLPSRLVLRSSNYGREGWLQMETVNTNTTVRFRAPAPVPSA